MNKSIKVVLGILISGFCVWFSFRQFKIESLIKILKEASWFWFLPATVIYCLGHITRSIRWHILLSPIKKINPLRLFPILMFGFLMNNILPARAGEFARAYSLNTRNQIEFGSGLGSIALERLTDLFGLMSVITLAAGVLPLTNSLKLKFLLAFLGILILLAFILIWAKNSEIIIQNDKKIIQKLMRFIQKMAMGLSVLQSWRKMTAILFISSAIWLNECVVIFLISKAFHLDLTIIKSAALVMGLSLGVMIPAAPGYVGTFEFFGKETLIRVGVLAAPALSFVLLLHFFYTSVNIILSSTYLFKHDVSQSNPVIISPTQQNT